MGDHLVISLDGWSCVKCGRPVNGQTDADGLATISGDSVRHVGPAVAPVVCEYTSGNVLVQDPVVCARNGCQLCAAELDERGDDSWWLV